MRLRVPSYLAVILLCAAGHPAMAQEAPSGFTRQAIGDIAEGTEQRTIVGEVAADAVPDRLQAEGLSLPSDLLAKLRGGSLTAEDIAAIRGIGAGVANAGVQNSIGLEVAKSYEQSSIIGKNLLSDGENVGQVADVVSGPSGEITHTVIDVGGFLGIGEKQIMMPVQDFSVAEDAGGDFHLDYGEPREALEAAPEYQGSALQFDPGSLAGMPNTLAPADATPGMSAAVVADIAPSATVMAESAGTALDVPATSEANAPAAAPPAADAPAADAIASDPPATAADAAAAEAAPETDVAAASSALLEDVRPDFVVEELPAFRENVVRALTAEAESTPFLRVWNGQKVLDPDVYQEAVMIVGVVAGIPKLCSGVMVAPDLVLSAAHCLCSGVAQRVIVGRSALLQEAQAMIDPAASRSFIPCDRLADSRSIIENINGGDLAIYKLRTAIASVPLRRVASDAMIRDAASIRAVGFGQNNTTATEMGVKIIVDIIIASWDCQAIGGSRPYQCAATHEMVAAGTSRDTCGGDSGGPVYILGHDVQLYVAAITSRSVDPTGACGPGGIYVKLTDTRIRQWMVEAGVPAGVFVN